MCIKFLCDVILDKTGAVSVWNSFNNPPGVFHFYHISK